MKAIHRQLFQDVYEWAGRSRDEQVPLSDGTVASDPLLYRPGSKPFAVGPRISNGLDALAAKLRDADYLRGLPRAEFAARAASVLAEVNSIHPFREGNGRTQRIFMQELSESAGHSLEFRVVSRERLIQASIAVYEKALSAWREPGRSSGELLARIQATCPRMYPDGLIRTVQRRVKIWRAATAHELVFGPFAATEVPVETVDAPS